MEPNRHAGLWTGLLVMAAAASSVWARDPAWIARYNDGNQDWASAMATDSAGNVYMAGSSNPDVITVLPDGSTQLSNGIPEGILVKYDSTGMRQWVVRYTEQPDAWVDFLAIAADSDGNVYVAGAVADPDVDLFSSLLLLKHDPNGQQVWEKQIAGVYAARRSLAVGRDGALYFTGTSIANPDNVDAITMKLRPDGSIEWQAAHDSPEHGTDSAGGSTLDLNGNLIVTGATLTGTGYRTLVIQYSAAGEQRWVARHEAPDKTSEVLQDMAVDTQGNIYVTAEAGQADVSSGSMWPRVSDYLTIKYSPDGNEEWVARYDSGDQLTDFPRAITVDPIGNILVTGASASNIQSSGKYGYATIKYNPDGQVIWVRRFDKPGFSLGGSHVASDGDENVYVTGNGYMGSCAPCPSWMGEIATIKYDSDGNVRWLAEYGSDAGLGSSVAGFALDGMGHLYVGAYGPVEGAMTSDFVLIQYPTSGEDVAPILPSETDQPTCGQIGLLPFILALLGLRFRWR